MDLNENNQKTSQYVDIMEYPYSYLITTLLRKIKRRLFSSIGVHVPEQRMQWSVGDVSDADGPAANVRNYIEQSKLREILQVVSGGRRLDRACEVGCGYGRVTMILKEFADHVKGFEREAHLVAAARPLLPDIEFQQIADITTIPDIDSYDFAMISAVLQHLNDKDARAVCGELKRLASKGHVLLIEKTEANRVTENQTEGAEFLSRAREISVYEDYMAPFVLKKTWERRVEPTYGNSKPGACMLFESPSI